MRSYCACASFSLHFVFARGYISDLWRKTANIALRVLVIHVRAHAFFFEDGAIDPLNEVFVRFYAQDSRSVSYFLLLCWYLAIFAMATPSSYDNG